MEKVCAWCNNSPKSIEIEENSLNNPFICSSCRQFLSMEQIPIEKIIENFNDPIVIIDPEHTVISSNTNASKLLDKFHLTPKNKTNKLGNLLRCPNAELEKGCGKTDQCSSCKIRQAIQDTLHFKQPEKKLKLDLITSDATQENHYKKTSITLSFQKAGAGLLIKITN